MCGPIRVDDDEFTCVFQIAVDLRDEAKDQVNMVDDSVSDVILYSCSVCN